MKPDGAIEPACVEMLKEVGAWMKANGEAIYGSRAWTCFREGENGVPSGMVYSGTAGLDNDPGRGSAGSIVRFANDKAFRSYRILVTRTRAERSDAVQYSEVRLLKRE